MPELFTKRDAAVLKVDADLGLVFGFAEITEKDGVEYFDLGGDARTEKAMLGAWTDFFLNGQVLGDMHKTADTGDVLFAFPMTKGIAADLGFVGPTYGMLVGIKPSPEGLAKFQSGEYTGFSIGGRRVEEDIVEA